MLVSFSHKSKLKNHDELKNSLLALVEDSNYFSPKIENCEVNISKTDWDFATDFTRPWVEKFLNYSLDHISNTYSECGYNHVEIFDIWFQQYLNNSEHGWHIHSHNFTNVYYLELPVDAPKTILVNPYNQKTMIELDVEEGDIVFFPSYVLHKTGKNKSEKRKTIVSYNLNVGYPDEFYGNFLNN